jgi:polysaccharide biosynthesis/export protein
MLVALLAPVSLSAQTATPKPPAASSKTPPPPPPAPAPNYIIGPDDVLVIGVWREDTVSGEVIVRPDGKITMKVGNDIVASGLTVDELKDKVTTELKKFYDPVPAVTIQVKQINSRRVYITGSVNKPGPYLLSGPMTVVQLIAVAGGLLEFADKKNIMLISATLKAKDGTPLTYKINYEDLVKGKNVARNNIELRPGDQVIVK